MKNKKLQNYIIITIMPVIIILSMTIIPLMTRVFGQEIILETEPFDPRDVFMGDHVVLKYKAENVSIDKFPESVTKTKHVYEDKYYDYATKTDTIRTHESYDLSSVNDKKLYAVLKLSGQYYEVSSITTEEPKGEIYIKLKNQKYLYYNDYTKTVDIDLGLDKFFVPENTGYDLEDAARHGQLAAKVKVLNGNTVLTDVYKK